MPDAYQQNDERDSYNNSSPELKGIEMRKLEFGDRLTHLSELAQRMRMLGMYVTILTACNLLGVLVFLAMRGRFLSDIPMATHIAITLLAITSLTMYANLRSRAEVIFAELSEEVQWFIGRQIIERNLKSPPSPPEFKPDLNTRIVLRTYAKATDLLFVPGDYGPGIYVMINLVVPVIWYVLDHFSPHY